MLKAIGRFIESKQSWFGYPLIVLMSFCAFAATIYPPDLFEQIEYKTLDQRFLSRGSLPPDQRIVILAVDDASLEKIGRWPWSRDKIGLLIERVIGEYGAAAMGFDIVFSEAQNNPLDESLRLLAENQRSSSAVTSWLQTHAEVGDVDAHFAQTLHRYGDRIVTGYFFYPQAQAVPEKAVQQIKQEMEHLQASAMTIRMQADHITQIPTMAGIEGNLLRFDEAVDTSGFFNFFPDLDGMIRRVPLLAQYGDTIYPNLDLQTLRVAMGWPELSATIGETGVENIVFNGREIDCDATGAMILNHYGPGKTFRHISAADVLQGKVDASVFKDAIVLIGVTAVGVYDFRPSPFDATFPGAEAHAVSMANILSGSEIRHPDWMVVIEVLGVFFFSLLCGILVYRSGAIMQSVSVIGVPVLIALLAEWLFIEFGLWMKVTYFIFGVLIATLPVILMRYIIEARQRAFIHDAFSHYLAPEVVNQLAKHPEQLALGGEARHLTAMFSDIAAFSSFSEGMEPEDLVHFLNLYLTAMSDIIIDCGGTIDKYEGDAIICFFGAPMAMENHAGQCVRAAIRQQAELARLRSEWVQQGYPEIRIRIGINSGSMVVGNMGTAEHMNYTMLGDHVNLASRLEGVCKVYRVPILISGDVHEQVHETIACRFIDRVRVVGRGNPVDLYEPIVESGELSAEQNAMVKDYMRAWDLMTQRQFVEAEKIFQRLVNDYHDNPADVLLARVREFMHTPPGEDWDGVYNLKSK
ncbi:MAG: adenylate/guanylate cyclase domain-containing protein [Mariprofundaceae bacterium]